jgi:hypothetical protein
VQVSKAGLVEIRDAHDTSPVHMAAGTMRAPTGIYCCMCGDDNAMVLFQGFVMLQAAWCWAKTRSATVVRDWTCVAAMLLIIVHSMHAMVKAVIGAFLAGLSAVLERCAHLQGASLRSRSLMVLLQSCVCGTVCCQR